MAHVLCELVFHLARGDPEVGDAVDRLSQAGSVLREIVRAHQRYGRASGAEPRVQKRSQSGNRSSISGGATSCITGDLGKRLS